MTNFLPGSQNPDKNLEIKWKKLEVILEKFKKSKKKIVVVIIPSIYQIDKKSEKTLMSTRINNNYNVNYPTKRLKKLLLKMLECLQHFMDLYLLINKKKFPKF